MGQTKVVKVGNLSVGGKNPLRIKGMLKTPTRKVKLLLEEAKALEQEGAQAIRIAVEKEKDAGLAKILKKHIAVPVAADIHFNPKLAFLSIKEGFDQIRLNPLNIGVKKDVKEIAKLARDRKIPIRVGVNSGGFKAKLSEEKAAEEMVKRCLDYIGILESQKLFDILVSLKSASIETTLIANKVFSKHSAYPLHLGITATGSYLEGIVKSSVGLGLILSEGLGDIIRVSLTADSLTEIKAAKYIVQSLGLGSFGPEIISCPTCSRCEVDLPEIVEGFRKEVNKIGCKEPVKIAIMGCVVNGPGEAAQADLGVAFSKQMGVFFRSGKVFERKGKAKIINDLIKELEKI